jgi:Mlc titration factor MtfA (ptsG expression regulator)
MSLHNPISASIPADQLNQIRDEIRSIRERLDFLVDLSPNERRRLRTLGKKLVAYARQVIRLAKENRNLLPSDLDLDALEARLQLYEDLQLILIYIDPLREGVSDTAVAAGAQVMEEVDMLYRLLKEAAKFNANIDTSLQQLSSWHQNTPAEEVESMPEVQ